MPPAAQAAAASGFTLDEDSNTIRFTREMAAAPDAVFAAWTEPEQVSDWWDPEGERLVRCDIDLRVGGSFTFVGRGHPEMPFSGVYREVSPPRRLVFDAMGAEGRIVLAPRGEGTVMTVEIICTGPEHLEQFVNMGVAVGTSQTLDNLVAHAERHSALAD